MLLPHHISLATASSYQPWDLAPPLLPHLVGLLPRQVTSYFQPSHHCLALYALSPSSPTICLTAVASNYQDLNQQIRKAQHSQVFFRYDHQNMKPSYHLHHRLVLSTSTPSCLISLALSALPPPHRRFALSRCWRCALSASLRPRPISFASATLVALPPPILVSLAGALPYQLRQCIPLAASPACCLISIATVLPCQPPPYLVNLAATAIPPQPRCLLATTLPALCILSLDTTSPAPRLISLTATSAY